MGILKTEDFYFFFHYLFIFHILEIFIYEKKVFQRKLKP